MTRMSTSMSDYEANADRFSAVADAGAGADWTAPSPCEGWSAADVLGHVVDTQRDFLAQRGADLGPTPTGSGPEVWAAHRDGVRRVTTDEAFVGEEYDGYFGRTSVADTLSTFYGFDMLVHRWDLARALGADDTWDDAELDRIQASLNGFGDALYSDGVCQRAVDVPADATRQERLLGRMGRRA